MSHNVDNTRIAVTLEAKKRFIIKITSFFNLIYCGLIKQNLHITESIIFKNPNMFLNVSNLPLLYGNCCNYIKTDFSSVSTLFKLRKKIYLEYILT